MRIFVIADWYLPGWKAGGALRSLANMVEACGDELEFYVVTRDRDVTDSKPYPAITRGEWLQSGNAKVCYLRHLSPISLSRLVEDIHPATTYLNSFFSKRSVLALVMHRLGCLNGTRIVISPHGEFSSGALAIKTLRKRSFLFFVERFNLLKDCQFHVSTQQEKADIVNTFSARHSGAFRPANVLVASDIPVLRDAVTPFPVKRPGEVRFVFLSRISKMKNLDGAFAFLQGCTGNIALEIFGPEDDPAYAVRCREAADRLPRNIRLEWHGSLTYEEIWTAFEKAHFLLLPTKGENFGHVIFEALCAGRPVLLSDKTPWGSVVDAGAGWCLPLAANERWISTLQHCVDMGDPEYRQCAESARKFIVEWHRQSNFRQRMIDLFKNEPSTNC